MLSLAHAQCCWQEEGPGGMHGLGGGACWGEGSRGHQAAEIAPAEKSGGQQAVMQLTLHKRTVQMPD